jgi:hypothetical protein
LIEGQEEGGGKLSPPSAIVHTSNSVTRKKEMERRRRFHSTQVTWNSKTSSSSVKSGRPACSDEVTAIEDIPLGKPILGW